MITENELQISNMSYTEKDFQSIYPSLLTLASQLTNRWDPASSNESDPGNVLIKLAAVVGDKTNYNIDKNVLECFLPSATQETSMRMLTDALGYNMKYYQSAIVDISFKYVGDLSETLTFPRFSTVVSNGDGTVYYTLISDVKVALKNFAVTGTAMEGSLNSLLVGNSEIIKLENLDDNNRLYFPELMVAQNGIFITNNGAANFEEWKLVDNINIQQPLTRCYKFSFDSTRGLPYIEFPSDIAELIGSGILVSYIVTKGANGNVSMGTLTQLTSYGNLPGNMTAEDIDNNLVVYNPSASTAGRDKETIDEAYTNYKKTIGTFDTLITTRDYANAIYNLRDQYNNPMVSNAAVADRVTDFNHALEVVSYDTIGQYKEFIPNEDMGVADLSLYPLKPYLAQNYNVYNPSYVYNESFTPLKTQNASDSNYTDDAQLVADLDDMKCIGHDFRDIGGDEVVLFKTVATLSVQLFTFAKVNVIEQAEIRNNVVKALSDNFNARELDYGYEIPYDSILNVIYSADSRIKSVSLSEPSYDVSYVTPENPYGEPISESDVMVDVIAKNVLAGKLSLFKYDNRFQWSFGQTGVNTYDAIESMTTSLTIPYTNSYLDYTVDKNEVIQLIAPTLSTTLIYPAGVCYRFTGNGNTIPANSNYVLTASDTLKIYYINSSGETVTETLETGTIIKPSFDLAHTTNGVIEYGGEMYDKIPKDNQLELRDKVEVKLENAGTPIYWVRNNANNVLFYKDQTNVLLDSGEYFIYSNPTLDNLVILGSGTSITRTGADTSEWSISNPISLENINVNGLSAFTSNDWQFKQFTTNNYLTIQQMQIITLGEGTKVIIDGATISGDEINGTFKALVGGTLTYDGEELENAIGGQWNIRTRLDVNCGPNSPQQLISNSVKTQEIELTSVNNNTYTIEGAEDNKYILFNYSLNVAGGENVNLLVTNLLTGYSDYSVSVAEYISKDVTETIGGESTTLDPLTTINISLDEAKTVTLPVSIERFETSEPTEEEIMGGLSANYDYLPFATYIVPLLVSLDENASEKTQIALSTAVAPGGLNILNLYDYNKGTEPLTEITASGLYNLEIVAGWQAEYESVADLNAQRPTYTAVELSSEPTDWPVGYYTDTAGTPASGTFVAGTYYVKINTVGDMCKVINATNSSENGIYTWTGSAWSLIPNSTDDNYEITMEITPGTGVTVAETLSIGKINKIVGLNEAIGSAAAESDVLQRIGDLTNNIVNSDGNPVNFFYTYTPDNSDVIETENMADAEAFWNVNNVVNKFTISQIDLDSSEVYIARSSQA